MQGRGMKNLDMLEISKTKETKSIIKISKKAKRKVKEYLNEKPFFGS